MTWVNKVLLALVVLASSAAAANRDPAQWESEIKAFEANDHLHPPPPDAVLFVGSSSIRLWSNLAASFPGLTTIRRGFGGSCLPDSTAFADRIIIPYRPAKIVLYAGENDIARGDSPREVYGAFREFVKKIQSALPQTPIYFVSIKPAPVRWYLSPQEREANRLIQDYCSRREGLHFVDVWPALLNAAGQPDPAFYKKDELHLNDAGYQRWAGIIGQALAGGATAQPK